MFVLQRKQQLPLMVVTITTLLAMLWLPLTVGASTGGSPGCRGHPEHLLVVCQGLNSSQLLQHLQQELTGSALSPTPHPWVQELKIVDCRLPVLEGIVPAGTAAVASLQLLQVVRSHVRQVRVKAMAALASSLRHLSLAHNSLVAVPAALSLLDKLEVLDLRHNAITRLSSLLARLPRLRHLKLDHNRIRQFAGWGTGSSLQQLTHLTHLGLADNLIHEVRSEALVGLTALQRLDLSRNSLQRLPPALFLPPALAELDLRGNPWYCGCGASWLTALQYTDHPVEPLVPLLPLCQAPEHLRGEPLAVLTEVQLCSNGRDVNASRKSLKDIEDHHMTLARVGARSFQLAWNVSNISSKGKKVQEYLGWRVTFREFGGKEESEVLLITLAGANVNRKTGSSSGRYTVRNLTPATAYSLCFQTLTDSEINNIIESQRGGTEEPIPITETPSPVPSLPSVPRGRSLHTAPTNEHPLASDLRRELDKFWKERLELSSTKEIRERTTLPSTTTMASPPSPNFVYTNTGERITLNFAPPGVPTNRAPTGGDRIQSPGFGDRLPPNFPGSAIPNVPPPPPPTVFGQSGSRFPFPLVRQKRQSNFSTPPKSKGKCIELITDEEDQLTMPVTVAATASSSSTMVILMICCCCFPKKCNRMRDCCVSKCKSIGKKTIIKTNSKTKTFVKPVKKDQMKQPYRPNISRSTPDLRVLENEIIRSEYNYMTLKKYYTMKGIKGNQTVELYPGYDFPKNTAAKYYGYDFPKVNLYKSVNSPQYHKIPFPRRVSTDDNMDPVVNDRFVYYNTNQFQTNLNIPVESCKYSDKIKGLYCYSSPKKINYSTVGPPRKISNYEHNIMTAMGAKLITKSNSISRSEPNLLSLNYPKESKNLHAHYTLLSKINLTNNTSQNNPGYGLSLMKITGSPKNKQDKMYKSHGATLEIVKHIDQIGPRRPALLNLSANQTNENTSNGLRIIMNPRSMSSEILNKGDRILDSITPPRPVALTNGWDQHPVSPVPIGEVAVTGGTLVEVPEGYVMPGKPRPFNVLRLKVPADSTTVTTSTTKP